MLTGCSGISLFFLADFFFFFLPLDLLDRTLFLFFDLVRYRLQHVFGHDAHVALNIVPHPLEHRDQCITG